MSARVKLGLGEGAIEALKRSNSMTLENLVADVVAEIVSSCRLDLSPVEAAEVRGLLEGHMELEVFHSGVQGTPLLARLAWEEAGSNLPISETLARKTDADELIGTVGVVSADDRFTIELLAASEFILDDWKDPDDPDRLSVAATKQEALAKAAAMRDHARYLERLANGKTLEEDVLAKIAKARGHVITGSYRDVLDNLDLATKALSSDERAH